MEQIKLNGDHIRIKPVGSLNYRREKVEQARHLHKSAMAALDAWFEDMLDADRKARAARANGAEDDLDDETRENLEEYNMLCEQCKVNFVW